MNLQQLYELRRAESAVGEKLAKLARRADFLRPSREQKAKAS
jgi:hypothetical protein